VEGTLVSLTSAAATGIRGNWMRGVHLQRHQSSIFQIMQGWRRKPVRSKGLP